MNVSSFFIHRPVLSTVLSVIIVIAGLLSLRVLPVEQYPQIVPPSVQVTATYPGASAQTVSEAVAAPIEQAINGVPDLLYIDSTSADSGTMSLSATFAIGTDPDQATIDVNNRVQQAMAQLPSVVQTQGVQVEKRSSTILQVITLSSPDNTYDSVYLSNYALVNIIDALKRTDGVGTAQLFGAKDYSIRVWLDPAKMADYNITTSEVADAISQQNSQFPAGKLAAMPNPDPRPYTFTITTEGRFNSVAQFEDILLRTSEDGSSLTLSDVARVELGAQDYSFVGRLNNQPAVPIGIYLQPGANALETAEAIQATLDRLSANFPEGMQYSVPYDTTKFVQMSINEVIKTFVEALALVVIVVFVFLQKWRAALVPIIAIPISIIGTFAGMYVLGFSVNLLTLFGMILAIGIVVDDAIIVIENVERVMEEEGLSPKRAALKAMSEISEPIIAVTLVMAAVFIPVGFLGGLSGQLYSQFAITIAISVLISAIVALTLSPAMCALLLKPHDKEVMAPFRWFNRALEKTTRGYMKGVSFFMRRVLVGLTLFAGFCVITFLLFMRLPGALVPQEDQGFILTITSLPAASSLPRTDDYNQELVAKLLEEESVENVVSFAGFDILAGAQLPNAGVAFVTLDDWSERSMTAQQLVGKTFGIGSTMPDGQVIAFNPPPIQGLSTTGGFEGYLQSTEGASPKEIEAKAQQVAQAANGRPELAQVRTTINTQVPSYKATIDRDKARSMGIPLSEIYATMQSTFGRLYVNDFTLFGRNFQVNLQSEADFRETPDDLNDIYVRAESGTMVPLSSVVSMERQQAPSIIQRFNLFPSAKIMGQPAPGYSSGQALDAMQEVVQEVAGQGYQLGWTGSAFQQQSSSSTSTLAFVFGLVMVILILAAQYERWSLPLVVITAVPFALFGATVAMLLRGLQNDIYFQIGLLVLIGLATKNAILIVEFAVEKRQEGMSVYQAAREAARIRFRPIIMTSFAFIVGVIPMAIATGASSASRHSIGTAVIGGMLGATLIAIFFVPMFYELVARAEDWFDRKRGKPVEDDGAEPEPDRG
ncbi:multidrug efflux pump [Modicisalibacter muralis]|uniref:Efflux pump membrane transporter n=1 Tax=Modicisalibacter muralis TaxID=119000 RepID=A0A1G9I9M7_9GAMM|nr:multidrug efflux RND transporter permease subunit [Halomonas muralis]SDL21544.1 multidrug efflux pump [Halomonas muralis]